MKKTMLVVALTGALVACGGNEKAEPSKAPVAEQKAQPAPQVEAKVPEAPKTVENPHVNAVELQKAQDALQALPQFAGKELNFFQEVNITNNVLQVNVQDPNKPENIDHYEYKWEEGKWSEPRPVQLSGGGDLKANLTPFKDVRFADVADKYMVLYNQIVEKEQLKPVEAVPSVITFVLIPHNQQRFWQASLDTDRSKSLLRMNMDGTLKEILK